MHLKLQSYSSNMFRAIMAYHWPSFPIMTPYFSILSTIIVEAFRLWDKDSHLIPSPNWQQSKIFNKTLVHAPYIYHQQNKQWDHSLHILQKNYNRVTHIFVGKSPSKLLLIFKLVVEVGFNWENKDSKISSITSSSQSNKGPITSYNKWDRLLPS